LYISSVCTGNVVLAAFDGIIDGHEIATSSYIQSQIKEAGGICKYSDIVIDDMFVTGRNAGGNKDSAPIKEMAQKLKALIEQG
ncbi:MAG: hypothetical protein MJA31_11595, partial [Clostridia bacterium]|nr:hypothetical protein [Clostridia bacterium]